MQRDPFLMVVITAWVFSTWINYASAEPQMDWQLSIDRITISQDICFSNAKFLYNKASNSINKNIAIHKKFAICEMWKRLFMYNYINWPVPKS